MKFLITKYSRDGDITEPKWYRGYQVLPDGRKQLVGWLNRDLAMKICPRFDHELNYTDLGVMIFTTDAESIADTQFRKKLLADTPKPKRGSGLTLGQRIERKRNPAWQPVKYPEKNHAE